MRVACSSETLILIYQTTRYHNSEDLNLNAYRSENLRYHNYLTNISEELTASVFRVEHTGNVLLNADIDLPDYTVSQLRRPQSQYLLL
jgi:hypothetical protein